MAIYMMKQKTFPRGKGACIAQAAAYRAGERIRDEHSGRVHSYLRPQSDERNHHAHLLLTPREVTPEGLGPRTTLELSGTERRAIGLGSSKDELLWRRQRWAEVANEALAGAGFNVRIDHRALRTIAPGREPELSLPLHIRKIELVTGKPTRVGEELRRQHRERVEARAKGPDEFARVVTRQKQEARTAIMRRRALEVGLPKRVPRSVLSREELLQERRERYQAEKERFRQMSPAQQSVQRWLKWKQRHPEQVRAPTAEESVRRWKAYREAQKVSEGREVAGRELSKDGDGYERRRKGLERGKDYGLEL